MLSWRLFCLGGKKVLIIEIALGIVLGAALLYLIFVPEFWIFVGCLLLLGICALFWSEIIEFMSFALLIILAMIGWVIIWMTYDKIRKWLARDKTSVSLVQKNTEKEENKEQYSIQNTKTPQIGYICIGRIAEGEYFMYLNSQQYKIKEKETYLELQDSSKHPFFGWPFCVFLNPTAKILKRNFWYTDKCYAIVSTGTEYTVFEDSVYTNQITINRICSLDDCISDWLQSKNENLIQTNKGEKDA